MTRAIMPSALPAEYAERVSDVDEGYTPAEETALNARADEIERERITSAVWWDETLKGYNSTGDELPAQMSRCMTNLDNACRGDRIAMDGILTALSILQRLAKQDARDDAREQAELELGGLP